jgi:transposase
MAGRGRPKAPLILSEVERQTLVSWSRRAKTAQALALRAKIVLACADGADNKDVAAAVGVWPQTVAKWRGRFVRDRLEGLSDEPRPGAARKITDERVEAVIVKTLEEAPTNNDTHWSTRSMANAVGLSQTAVSRIWRAFGIKPHLVDTWKLSKDPQFIEKVRGRDRVRDHVAIPARAAQQRLHPVRRTVTRLLRKRPPVAPLQRRQQPPHIRKRPLARFHPREPPRDPREQTPKLVIPRLNQPHTDHNGLTNGSHPKSRSAVAVPVRLRL